MQYVHLLSKAATSIEQTISLQSTPMLKKLHLHMFEILPLLEKKFIVCSFQQDFSKGKGRSLYLICNAHTAF